MWQVYGKENVLARTWVSQGSFCPCTLINWHSDSYYHELWYHEPDPQKSIIKSVDELGFRACKPQAPYHSESKGGSPCLLRALWGIANPLYPKRGPISTSSLAVFSFVKSLEYKETTIKGQDSNPDSAVLPFNPEQRTLSPSSVSFFSCIK